MRPLPAKLVDSVPGGGANPSRCLEAKIDNDQSIGGQGHPVGSLPGPAVDLAEAMEKLIATLRMLLQPLSMITLDAAERPGWYGCDFERLIAGARLGCRLG